VRGAATLPVRGSGAPEMKQFYAAASALLALGSLALGGCETVPLHLDPLALDGRDGGKPLSYETVMRIAADAHAAGDFASAVAFYRRAATINTGAAAPYVGAGMSLVDMGRIDEAIIAYNAALTREDNNPDALRGLAKAELLTGRAELAGHALAAAYSATPNDPKLLELIGVADDFAGQHAEAQARYRRGLELAPHDPGLSRDLALSLALTGDYLDAIAVLRPFALALNASSGERQTLALIYGLAGNRLEAERIARLDLDPQSVEHNLAFYDSLRRLSPEARSQAIRSLTTRTETQGAS
jgi:Flp pilus assembly protein TadD